MAQSFVEEITKLFQAREQEREARRLQASLSPPKGTRGPSLRSSASAPPANTRTDPQRAVIALLCRRLCERHG